MAKKKTAPKKKVREIKVSTTPLQNIVVDHEVFTKQPDGSYKSKKTNETVKVVKG